MTREALRTQAGPVGVGDGIQANAQQRCIPVFPVGSTILRALDSGGNGLLCVRRGSIQFLKFTDKSGILPATQAIYKSVCAAGTALCTGPAETLSRRG